MAEKFGRNYKSIVMKVFFILEEPHLAFFQLSPRDNEALEHLDLHYLSAARLYNQLRPLALSHLLVSRNKVQYSLDFSSEVNIQSKDHVVWNGNGL